MLYRQLSLSAVALAIFPASSLCLAQPKGNATLPRPVPVVEHVNGTTTTFDLARHLPLAKAIQSANGVAGLEIQSSGTALVITGSGKQTAVAEIKVDGYADSIQLVVRPNNRPQVPFVFRPTGTAKEVSAVGSFNGWSAGRNALIKQDDGSFRLVLPLDPGTYEYKFVVDGNWMPDPQNPNRKSDGFQGFNSILTVAGEAGAAGRLVQAYSKGDRVTLAVDSLTTGPAPEVDPASIIVLHGNEAVSGAEVKDGKVVLPPTQADELTAVRVFARDTNGRDIEPARFVAGKGQTWRDEILYFVFTDRFRDGDPKNNNPIQHPDLAPQANYHGGDFDGLRQAIEEGYFKKLGVTALWISPPQRQPAEAWKDAIPPNRMYTGYHGYWPVAAREVNPHFGTTESLKKMVAAAHANGLKVIMDCVANHVHVDHPYYKNNPEWFGTYNLPDGRKNLRLFDEFPLTTWFDTFLPKFDYARNPDAIKAVVDDMAWWVETFGFDGLRHDATKHIPHEFWIALTARLRQIEAERGRAIYQVGESIAGRDVIMDYVNAAEMDGQFDFPLYWPIRGAFATGRDGLDSLVGAMKENHRLYGGFAIQSAFVGNHDFSRFTAFASEGVAPDGSDEKEVAWKNPPKQPTEKAIYDRLRMAHTFVMTQPDQAPLVYYGDEFGLTGAGDPDNRRPMLFGKDVPSQGKAVMDHVANLTAVRKAHPALRTGDTTILHSTPNQLAYLRSNANERILVGINRGSQSAVIPVRVPSWALAGNAAKAKVNRIVGERAAALTADEGPGQFVMKLPPQSSAVFLIAD